MSHTVRKLRVRRFAVTQIDSVYFSAYRFRVEAAEAVAMEKQVFLYRRAPPDPYTQEVVDTFFSVCSPVDMVEYPAEAPDPNKAYPFFRKDFVELDLRRLELALAAEALIVAELNVLVHALNRLEDLELADDFWIGPFPGDPDHGSEDGSASDSASGSA